MKLRRQALLSLSNTATSALALLLVFRLGFQFAGAEAVGLWAFISGLLIFARMTDTGASLAISRQLVIDRAEGRSDAGSHLWAGLTVASLPTAVIALAISCAAFVMMGSGEVGQGRLLGPALLAGFLYAVGNSISGVFAGCLDGCGLMVTRFGAGIVANLLLIGLALVLVPAEGFDGFLLAHVLYSAAQCLLYALALAVRRVRLGFHGREYRRVARLCYRFISQSIVLGAARAGFEPVSKFLIMQAGGLGAVAAFDLANRISAQLRQMVNAPLQPIAVATARTTSAMDANMRRSVERWMFICIGFGFLAAALQILTAPFVEKFIVLHAGRDFVVMSALLATAFFVNFAGTVAYYVIMSSGRISQLVFVHLAMVVLNVVLGFLAGQVWGALGVVAAWSFVLALGGPAVLFLYQASQIMGRNTGALIGAAVVGGGVVLGLSGAAAGEAAPLFHGLADSFLTAIGQSGPGRHE